MAAARVGGVPAFVTDDRNGVLFDPDRLETMVAALESLLRGSERPLRLARAGRREAREHYDWSRITERLIRLYEDVRHAYPVRQ